MTPPRDTEPGWGHFLLDPAAQAAGMSQNRALLPPWIFPSQKLIQKLGGGDTLGTTSAGAVASAAARPERFWHHLLDKTFPGMKTNRE